MGARTSRKIADVQAAVCRHFGVTVAEMTSPALARHIVRPRMVAMHLARRMTTRSYPQIGHYFGGRDHSTAVHAHSRIAELRAMDAELNAKVRAVVADLNGGAR